MKKVFSLSILCSVCVVLSVLLTSYNLVETEDFATSSEITKQLDKNDVLDIIYSIADRKGMRVISDLNMAGGGWYEKISPITMGQKMKNYADRYNARYGSHKSFWGWYLNNEINPIKTTEVDKSAFWRKVFKYAVDECHRIHPGSMVTISPFFLLDKDGLRGFEYLQPSEYEKWWAVTLKETGIDILMLQESGEHQAFFTLAEREPFIAAFANACKQAGAKFWVNVETGQVDAKDWAEAIRMEKNKQKKWEFTPMSFLAQKLALASKYGEDIVNWGYFPFMNPINPGPWIADEVDGQKVTLNSQIKSYNDYREYYEKLPDNIRAGDKCRPLIRGTLWALPANYKEWSKKAIKKILEEQIDRQKALGFDILWLVNTPANMDWAKNTH